MYKLEFALPKFRMYRRILAKILAEDFIVGRGWSETQVVQRFWLVGLISAIIGVASDPKPDPKPLLLRPINSTAGTAARIIAWMTGVTPAAGPSS